MPSAEELAQRYLALARALSGGKEMLIPAGIFSSELSPLRSLVTYLKNVERYSFKRIAQALHRSYPTIYAAYAKRLPVFDELDFYIPLERFDSSLSVLETVVAHLKEEYGQNLSEIARLLNKDPRTMWATYDRAKKKRGGIRG